MPSENVEATEPAPVTDRRARKREARRQHLLALAADLVDERGVAGLTMAALAEASDYATASLYTYFPSRSALVSALQVQALGVLAQVAEEAEARWEDELTAARATVTDEVAALAALVAFSELFLTAPEHHPREFRLQQELLVAQGVEEAADASTVVPAAMVVLDTPRRLLAAAEAVGALAPHEGVPDPLDQLLDGPIVRTFAWVVAMNGALLTDRLVVGLPTTSVALGRELTDALLRGWGAPPHALAEARRLAAGWAA